MERRVNDDIFGPYAPNLNFTSEELFAEDQLGSPLIHLEDELHENQQNSQQQSQQLERIDWSPLKGKSREIIESLSNAMPMSMPSTSSAALSLNHLFSMSSVKTPISFGIEPEEEEEEEEEEEKEEEEKEDEEQQQEEEIEQSDDKDKEYTPEDSSESQSESESNDEVADDDSDYEPTNEEEKEVSVVVRQQIKGIGRQKANKSEEVRHKKKLNNSTFEGGNIPPNYVEIKPVNGKRYIRKSQKGINKDCGWAKVVENAPRNDIAEEEQQQPVDDSQNFFRRTKGRWQQYRWKFVCAMPINEEMEIEIKRKYAVYAFIKAKPTNLRCRKYILGCPYKMLLRKDCEDVPAGFVHLYERNDHNHEDIEAPVGFHQSKRAECKPFSRKHNDWRYVGRRSVQEIMAHKKANGLRGHIYVQKSLPKKGPKIYQTYLRCGFISFDGQQCEYQVRAKKNEDCIDDDEPTFTVYERNKHNHENTMEDVEFEDDDDEEDGNALEDGDCLNNVQIQEQSTSTLLETVVDDNNLLAEKEMDMANSSNVAICQSNDELEIEEENLEKNLNRFKLPTETVSIETCDLHEKANSPIVDVDLLVLVPKIKQSAQELKKAWAERRKRIRKETIERNAQRMGGNIEDMEMEENVLHCDAPLWEGTEMMRKLAKRIAENSSKTAEQQQPSTSAAAIASFSNANENDNNIPEHTAKHRCPNEQSNLEDTNSSTSIVKPIPIKDTTATDVVKIKWRHIGQWTSVMLYKTIINEPWTLYGKNGWIYYYKCARKMTNGSTEPCNYRVRVNCKQEAANKCVIYESGQHSCGRDCNFISQTINANNQLLVNKYMQASCSIEMRKLRNRVWSEQKVLGQKVKRIQKHREINWYSIPGEWIREKMYQRARDEHGLRLYLWRGMTALYFECEQIGSDGQPCDFKLRAKQIEGQTTASTAKTIANCAEMPESNNMTNGGQKHPGIRTEQSNDGEEQQIYKICETVCWHNHETTVFPIGRQQYKLSNVDLSQWKFLQYVHNGHEFQELRCQLHVLIPSEHFRSLRQAILGCSLKPNQIYSWPLMRACSYRVLVFRKFKHGPIHVYERGEHKHSVDNEQDFIIDGELRRRGFMDDKWMPIAEGISKEELFQHAQLHELQQYLRRGPTGCGFIYFKCDKIGSGGRICIFQICGKKAMDRQNSNDRTKIIGGNGMINECDDERGENNDNNGNGMLYDLFETKYWHNHECAAAPVNQRRMPIAQKMPKIDNLSDHWNLKTTIYDDESFEEFKNVQGVPRNLPHYYITQIRQICWACNRKDCKYKIKICREFYGGPLKIFEHNEHNHPANETQMEVVNRIGTQNSCKTLIKNGKIRHRKAKSIEIAQKQASKSKYCVRNKSSTILNQLIIRHLDGPQMNFEQFSQAFLRIEKEERQKDKGEWVYENSVENDDEQNVQEIGQNQDEDEIQVMPPEVRENLTENTLVIQSDGIEVDERNGEQILETITMTQDAFNKEGRYMQSEDAMESLFLPNTSKATESSQMASIAQESTSIALSKKKNLPITSAARIFDNQQERRHQNESEFLIPMLGQGPSAFRKPSPMRLRSSSMLNFPPINLPPLTAFAGFEQDRNNRQTRMSSISAPTQFNGIPSYSQELPTTSIENAVQSGADPHFWKPTSHTNYSSEANGFEVNAMAEQICREFMDFEEFGNSAESIPNLMPNLEPCDEINQNLDIDAGGNNSPAAEEGEVFSGLAPPLSPQAENGQKLEEENECEIVGQTSATMSDVIAPANAEIELNGAKKVVGQNLAIHAEPEFPVLSRQEKLRMGALFGSYLYKWKRNQHMKQKIIQGRREESDDEIVGKMKTLRAKKKQCRPRGLFVTTRGAKRRAEEEKRRRQEFVPQKRGAYLDDSSDEDEDRTVENDEDYAFEELEEENDIDIIKKVVKEIVNFVANDEEIILCDVASTSQNAFIPQMAIKRRNGRPFALTSKAKRQKTTSAMASLAATSSLNNRKRRCPLTAGLPNSKEKEMPTPPKHSKETHTTPSNQSRLLIVNIADRHDHRIEGNIENDENAATQSQGNASGIRYLHTGELTKAISIGQLGKIVLAYLIGKEKRGELAKDSTFKWEKIVEKIVVDRARWTRLNRYLLKMLEALEILEKKDGEDQLSEYLWKGLDAMPTLMASLKSKAEAMQMAQKISFIEKKLRKSHSTFAIKTEECKIFEKKPNGNGGQKMVHQMCRRFLMILLSDHMEWAFGSDILCLLMGFELKYRRTLCDVLNVLTELKLVKKLHFTTAASRIPIYAYSGPKPDANPLTATDEMRYFQNRLNFMQNLTTAAENSRSGLPTKRNDEEGTSSKDTKHEDLAELRHCLEQTFQWAPQMEPPPSPATSISSTGTIAAEIYAEGGVGDNDPNINSNSQMPQTPPKATIINMIQTNEICHPNVHQPYFLPIIAENSLQTMGGVNAVGEMEFVDWQRPDCFADVGAETIIGVEEDAEEMLDMTGELEEIKEEQNDWFEWSEDTVGFNGNFICTQRRQNQESNQNHRFMPTTTRNGQFLPMATLTNSNSSQTSIEHIEETEEQKVLISSKGSADSVPNENHKTPRNQRTHLKRNQRHIKRANLNLATNTELNVSTLQSAQNNTFFRQIMTSSQNSSEKATNKTTNLSSYSCARFIPYNAFLHQNLPNSTENIAHIRKVERTNSVPSFPRKSKNAAIIRKLVAPARNLSKNANRVNIAHLTSEKTQNSRIVANDLYKQKNVFNLAPAPSSSNVLATEVKPKFHSMDEEVVADSAMMATTENESAIDDEADDRRQLEIPSQLHRSFGHKNQRKRRINRSNNPQLAKRQGPNEFNNRNDSAKNSINSKKSVSVSSNSYSTPLNRGRGRPFGSTKQEILRRKLQKRIAKEMRQNHAATINGNNFFNLPRNNENAEAVPPGPRFYLNNFDFEQLELLGAEWGLRIQKRGQHLLFFKPVKQSAESKSTRILRHTTMGLLLMDNGDHVQVDECEFVVTDGSYRPNAKPTDRWYKGSANAKKFLRRLYKKMVECFKDEASK